jgi:hypothetical protein
VVEVAALPAKVSLVVPQVKTMVYLALALAVVVVLVKMVAPFLTTQEVVKVEMA